MFNGNFFAIDSLLGKRLTQLFIIMIAAALYFSIFYLLVGQNRDESVAFLTTDNTVPLVPLPICETASTTAPSTNKVAILRVDDIQAYSWSETSLHIMNDAAARNIPLNIGLIPFRISTDRAVVNALRTYSCLHEVALHGYDHGYSINHAGAEFASYNQVDASARIAMGLAELAQIELPRPTTWIPPRNQHSAGTIAAVKDHNFTVLSAEGDNEFDYDTSVTDYSFGSLVAVEDIVSVCNDTLAKESECVIMIHPQDFVDGPDHDDDLYQTHYIALLDTLISDGYSFTTFQDASARSAAVE